MRTRSLTDVVFWNYNRFDCRLVIRLGYWPNHDTNRGDHSFPFKVAPTMVDDIVISVSTYIGREVLRAMSHSPHTWLDGAGGVVVGGERPLRRNCNVPIGGKPIATAVPSLLSFWDMFRCEYTEFAREGAMALFGMLPGGLGAGGGGPRRINRVIADPRWGGEEESAELAECFLLNRYQEFGAVAS